MKITKSLLAFAILTYLGTPLQVQAHENNADINVTVATDFTKEEVKANPETKAVLYREDLDNKGARNLADALTGEQNIQFGTDDMGRATISIRGAEPRHTLFLVDGKRLAGGLSKFNGATDEIYRLGTDDVERVEIIRGASAAKYGADAIGGAVNIITKIPDKFKIRTNFETDKLQSSGKYQYNDTVTISTGKIGAVKAEATYGKSKTAPFLYGDHEDSMQYHGKRYPFNVKAEVDLGKDWGTLRYDHSKLTEKLGKDTELTNQYKPKSNGFKNIYVHLIAREEAERVNNSISWSKDSSKAHFNLRYYNSELSNDTNFFTIQRIIDVDKNKKFRNLDMIIPTPYFDTFKTRKDVYEASINLMPDDKHLISIEASHTKDHGEGTRIRVPEQSVNTINRTYVWELKNPENFYLGTMTEGMEGYSSVQSAVPKYINSATIKTDSYAVTDEYQVNDKVLLVSALRYDRNSKFGNRLSPKLGVTYSKSNSLRYKFNVGTGFATPGVAELYHNWEMYEPSLNELPPFRSGWFFRGNPDLKPEKSLNFDLSLENEKGKTSTKVTLFRNNFKDFMQIVYDGQMPSPNLAGFTHYDNNIRYFNPYSYWGEFQDWEEFQEAVGNANSLEEKLEIASDLDYVKGIPPLDDIYTYKNISKSVMQGIELETKHDFSKAFSGKLGYTFLDARDKITGKRLEGRGRHLFNLSLNYKDVKHGFRANFWGTYTRNYLDIRDRIETGRVVLNKSGDNTPVVPQYIFDNPKGDPVAVFQNERDARRYSDQINGLMTYTKEKRAKEKNYGVWHIMFEKDLGKHATIYAGVNNLFGAKDEFLNLGGRVYRLGFKTEF